MAGERRRGVSGEMVRDLMTESLEHRFVLSAPHPIEWLSDNGPCLHRARHL